MSDQMLMDTMPPLSLHHVKTTTTVFIGVTEVAFRTRSDIITGERTNLESALYQPIRINNWLQFQQTFGRFVENANLPDAVYGYFTNGGVPCYVVSIQVIKGDGDPVTGETYIQALQALDSLAESYLLVCPDLASHYDQAHIKQVQRAMITHCEQTTGCFAILDPPPGLNAQEVMEFRQVLNADSDSAALYYPWIKVPDLSDSPRLVKAAPPSGHVAGIFYRVQQKYKRVLAPANEVLFNALALQIYITQGEDDILLSHQVNCIRTFSERGIRLWGARTFRNDFIIVGNETETTAEIEQAESRIPTLKSLDTVTPAFIGITKEASIKVLDYDSGERVPQQSFLNTPGFVDSWQAYMAIYGDFLDNAYLPDAVYGFFANGGQQCYIISLQSVTENDTFPLPPLTVNDFIGNIADRSGLAGLEALGDVDLIVCPDLMLPNEDKLFTDDIREKIKRVQTAVIAHCERMGDRMAILDMLPNLNPLAAKEWRYYVNYDSSYAMMYYPWIDILDHAGRRKRIPASGHIAGVYQRQSQQYGLHKPPANAQIYGAVNLAHDLTNGEQTVLTPIGINCLRAFPNRGIRPWSARTLSSDAAFRYIHTRRMLIMIQSAIYQGTSWVQFERHDSALLARVRQQIGDFLEGLRSKGMLVGDSSEAAYFIQCDEELNPPEKQKQGEFMVKIGVTLTQDFISQFYVRQTNSIRRMMAEVWY